LPGVLKVVFSLIHSLGRSFDNLGVFMPIKTDGLVHLFIVAATIIASVGLFAISLFYPAFNLSDGSSYGGLVTLLIGWMGLLGVGDEKYGGIGLLAWYANLCLVPVWLGLVLPKFRFATIGGLTLVIIGLGLASSALLMKSMLIDEGGHTAEITSMGLGFYLWLSSFVICVVGYLAVITWGVFNPKKAMTNQ
jgi:hypothetical protein